MNEDIYSLIRSKLDIVDIISEYIPLSKQGKNFFGVCPFHDDNNPSMSVSREKQIYKCFSCGASGNVFTFVQNYEQISFKETLSILASKAGVELEKNFITKEKLTPNDKFYQMYDLANRFYQNNIQSGIGIKAKEYLKSRGIDENTIKEFEIGLSTNSSKQLTTLLEKKGYTINDLNQIGLSIGDKDIYQARIMFPLYDTMGRCIAFSGRRYLTSDGSKYVNTKETKIFIKGNNLYNYHRAREAVRLKKQVIVREGFMDVIRASTIDVKNVVALMGTAMTKEQVGLIKRLSTNVILCFDGDDAGRHATVVNGEVLQKEGLNVKVIELFNDDDPDTYILNHGKENFEHLIDNAITYQDFKIKNLKNGKNFNSDEEKAEYIHEVLKETSKIKDEIRREIILKKLAIEFNLSYNTLEKGLNELLQQEKTIENIVPIFKVRKSSIKDKYYVAPRAVLYYMIENDKVLDYYNKNGIFFINEKFRTFASEIAYSKKKYEQTNIADYFIYLSDKPELLQILQEIVKLDLEIEEEHIFDAVNDYIKVMEEEYRNQEIKRLKELIKNTIDFDEKLRLSERVQNLKKGVE